MSDLEDRIGTAQVCEILDLSQGRLSQLTTGGYLPAKRFFGPAWSYLPSDVEEFDRLRKQGREAELKGKFENIKRTTSYCGPSPEQLAEENKMLRRHLEEMEWQWANRQDIYGGYADPEAASAAIAARGAGATK
jgi:hypothetical protein